MSTEEQLDRVAELRGRGAGPKQVARALGIRPGEAARLVREAAARARSENSDPAVVGCWISPGWSTGLGIAGENPGWPVGDQQGAGTEGLVSVLLARRHRFDRVSVAGYLVDAYCLGVKDALGPEITDEAKLGRFSAEFFSAYSREPLAAPLELARELVFGAVEYARGLGFSPHPDFAAARELLGSWSGPGVITFGNEGKPEYVAGPYDDPQPIIRKLERSCGRGNFHFTMPMGPLG
jgi:hypothetical protein